MDAKIILAVLAALFLAAAVRRLRQDGGIGPASRTWLLVGTSFALVSAWLWWR